MGRGGGSSSHDSHVPRPTKCPTVHKVHRASISSSRPAVCPSKLCIVTCSTGPCRCAVLVGNGSSIARPHHWQLSQDGRYWNDVHHLFPRKQLVNQLGPTLRNPILCKNRLLLNTSKYTKLLYGFHTRCLQIDVVAEGDVCTIDLGRSLRDIRLYRH